MLSPRRQGYAVSPLEDLIERASVKRLAVEVGDHSMEHNAQLRERRREDAPFADPAGIRERGVTWVEPQLVAQIGFTEWTRDGRLRHPRFLGLRDDKAASEVVREAVG